MALLQKKVNDGCRGFLVEYSPFPFDESSGTEHLPVTVFPGKKVLAPSASSLDNSWVNPDYARSLPKLCAADLLGLHIYASNGRLEAIALATEDLAVIWRLVGCDALPYDLELLLAGPIPKCGLGITQHLMQAPGLWKPLPLDVGTFRDLARTTYSMRPRGASPVTRPWEAYLGFRIPEVNSEAWHEPLWAELVDEQVQASSTAAWSSLLVCRAMERSPGTTLVQCTPFLSSANELRIMEHQQHHLHTYMSRQMAEVCEASCLQDLHAVPLLSAAREVREDFDLDKSPPAAPVVGDVWTETHHWHTLPRGTPRMFALASVTAAVTLLAVDCPGRDGKPAKTVNIVRPGLVPRRQVTEIRSSSGGSGSKSERKRQRHENVDAYGHMLACHRNKVDHGLVRLSNTQKAEVFVSVAPLSSFNDDELASEAVAAEQVFRSAPSSAQSPRAADEHLKLHAKRLRDFTRVALRLNVAPFVLVTVSGVSMTRPGGDIQSAKQCSKRPLAPCYTYESVLENGAGGGTRRRTR